MEYRTLGDTPLKVSELCLGTMTFGEQNSQLEAFAQMDMALDYRVNFFDTAEMYAVPPTAKTYGSTETIIGHWLCQRNNRDKIILASKASGPGMPYIRGGSRHTRDQLFQAVESSLERLQTDYIDLYQLHWPDRATNFFGQLGFKAINNEHLTPLLETIEALNDLVTAGKIRHWGLSNDTAWGAMKSAALADTHDYPRPVSIQNPYNLLNRSFEVALSEVAHREHIGLLAYSPLGFGTLTGKYLDGARPEGSRLTRWSRFDRYSNAQAQEATARYARLAQAHDLNFAQMSLQFVTQQPFVTSNIIGATSLGQLQQNLESTELKLSTELLDGIEAIQQAIPNPAP